MFKTKRNKWLVEIKPKYVIEIEKKIFLGI